MRTQDRGNGPQHDREICAQGTSTDICQIEFHPLIKGQFGASTDLSEAEQTGLHVMTSLLSGSQFRCLRGVERPGANYAHLSTQHVHKLRKLIK